jgi:hypothetical protein
MHAWGNGTCRRRLVSLVVAVVSLLTVASAQAAELLVGNVNTDQVLRYDGTTGAFLDAFVAAGSGGLSLPGGLVFGPDGALYVSSRITQQVLCYNGTTGAFLNVFVAAGSGGLNIPSFLTFGPRGSSGPAQTSPRFPRHIWGVKRILPAHHPLSHSPSLVPQ